MQCLECRGRSFCGKSCPMLPSFKLRLEVKDELFGSSPPSVFVGRYGYPKVRICPALPPFNGDTEIFDTPELWGNLPVERILKFRYSMIMGQLNIDVRKRAEVQELSLYNRPVEVEISFAKPPKPKTRFDEVLPPFGPSAPAKEVRICSTPSPPKAVEKVYDDSDMRAVEGMKYLYEKGIAVSHIQKLLSAGNLGVRRKLVPTRWAITAVDDSLSKHIIQEVKLFETIDKYRVFFLKEERNLFMALLCPSAWSYEWGEAWFPNTTWNSTGKVGVLTDWEGYFGRKSYAKLGGCYYASRLATAEYLRKIGRQAKAIVWREIYPGFKTAVGVWFVRERLRKLYASEYREFDTLDEALRYMASFSSFGMERWLRESNLVKARQRRLWEFA